jgi:hypothetical protein
MKYTKLLALPMLSLMALSIGPSQPKFMFISTKEVYGPFTDSENTNIYFEVLPVLSTVSANIDVYNNKTNAFLFSRAFTLKMPFDEYFRFDTKGRITSSGLRVEMSFTNGVTTLDKSLVLYPPKRNKVVASNNKVSFDGCLLNITNNNFLTTEEYDFTPINSFISSDNENKIDVSETFFKYSPANTFKYSSAYLEITDYENIYPEVLGSNKQRKVPLKVNEKDGEISFEIESQMYVNYNTLEMSSFKENGYSKTNSFFVPMGKEEALSKNDFKIVIVEAGFNLNTIEIPLEYFNFSKVFGSCGESDYCIHGGIKE